MRSLNTVTFSNVHANTHGLGHGDAHATSWGQGRARAPSRLSHENLESGGSVDDDDDERTLALVQHKGFGCRLSKESNSATMTTATLRSEERYRSSVSSGPTVCSGPTVLK